MDTNEKRNITVGVGVTTTPNRKHLYDQWMEQFKNHTYVPHLLHVHCDEQYRGVAYSKNKNLRALKDCDHVFLFDDDCWPIHDEWIEFFINSNQDHLLYLDSNIHGPPNYCGSNPLIYQNCGGVFMYMTRKAIEKVGAFNEKFNPYGFEHAEYSNRIIGKPQRYPMLKGTENYLRALDYEGYNMSSLTDKQKQKYVRENWDKYFKEQPTTYIPL